MKMGEIHGFSHLGLCVSDLARSLRFYCEAKAKQAVGC